MSTFFGKILGKLLRFVYDNIASLGAEPKRISYYAISIIVTTIIFKIILLPLIVKQSKSTKKMAEIQPKIMELQEKYKNDPQNLQVKMSQLYKEHNYNPASGCLMLLIQMPIIIGFFKVMRDPVIFAFKDPGLYEAMNKSFLWIKTLETPDPYMWGLPLLAALTTYLQTLTMKTSAPANKEMEATQKSMNIFLPVMIFISARSFPAGLALYWVINNLFTIIQQLITNYIVKKQVEKKELKEGN